MDLRDIEIQDIKYLELDLSKQELVSIVFLFYGAQKSKYILQKLDKNPTAKNFLEEFAKSNQNWKSALIEVLAKIKCFECIENLGVAASEAREFSRKSSIINGKLKILYDLCEFLDKESNDKLIKHIKDKCQSARKVDDDQLEIYFIHCLAGNLIKITDNEDECDFTFITNFFQKQTKTDKIGEILKTLPVKSNALDNSESSGFNGNVQVPTTTILEDYYTRKMLVLIINQETFTRDPNLTELLPEKDLNERKGTRQDMEALKKLFDNFNYQVIVKTNLEHLEIFNEIGKVVKQSSQFDGLILCILSHGNEGLIFGSNSVPVMVKDIKTKMSSKNLLNKPKILLIQACQGTDLQQTVRKYVSKTEFDGPTQSGLISGSIRADFLTFWSTIEGFASVRHVDNGSWFIQELVKVNIYFFLQL
jgi:caspase 8